LTRWNKGARHAPLHQQGGCLQPLPGVFDQVMQRPGTRSGSKAAVKFKEFLAADPGVFDLVKKEPGYYRGKMRGAAEQPLPGDFDLVRTGGTMRKIKIAYSSVENLWKTM